MKKVYKLIFLVIIFFSFITVFAYSYLASDVGFTPVDPTWDVDNTKDALDDLYNMRKCDDSMIGLVWQYEYLNGKNIFVAPCEGKYKLEVWGAQGGSYNTTYRGGYGGYTVGVASLEHAEILYVHVGGAGRNAAATGSTVTLPGGYNGGGQGSATSTSVLGFASGGGATHIAKVDGVLSSLSSNIPELLVIAGGGGGSWYQTSGFTITVRGGDGGGYIGVNANGTVSGSSYTFTTGGTQTEGGKTGAYNQNLNTVSGQFGKGGGHNSCGSGSGGGLYGGGNTQCIAGAGGSGYFSQTKLIPNTSDTKNNIMWCYGCSESSALNTYTLSTTGSSKDSSICPNGYSAGAVSKCAKSGNGFAKITYLGAI